MLRRPYYIAIILVVLLALALMSQAPSAILRLKQATAGLFLPLFGVTASTRTVLDKNDYALTSRGEIIRRLQEAEAENTRLKLQAQQYDETARENGRLREALGLPRTVPWKLRMARVVGREPANWWRNIRINVGSRDGIVNNLPVICPDGLVGRLSEVGYTHSQVVLLGDPDCRVSVLVEDTRDHGVIAPADNGPVDNTIVDLKYLSRNSVLKPGQRVITSGLGGVFPKGILVGRVADVRMVQYGLQQEARVSLAARLNALEEVWVIMP